jgi:hypothetical protein
MFSTFFCYDQPAQIRFQARLSPKLNLQQSSRKRVRKCCGEPQKCSLAKLGEVAERFGGAGSALFISAGLLHH